MMQEHEAGDDGVDDINRDGAGFLGQDVLVNPGPELFERGAEEAKQNGAAEQGKHDSEMNQVLRDGTGDVRAQVAEAQFQADGQQCGNQDNGQQDTDWFSFLLVHRWIPPVNGLGSGDNNSTNILYRKG